MVDWKKKYLKYKIKYKKVCENLYTQKAGKVKIKFNELNYNDYIELDILKHENLKESLKSHIYYKFRYLYRYRPHNITEELIKITTELINITENIIKSELEQLDKLDFSNNIYGVTIDFGDNLPIENEGELTLLNIKLYLYSFLKLYKLEMHQNGNIFNYILFYNLLNILDNQKYLHFEEVDTKLFDFFKVGVNEFKNEIFKNIFKDEDERYIKKITLHIDDLKSYELYVKPESGIYDTLLNFFDNYEADLKFARKNQDNIQNPNDIYNEDDIFENCGNEIYLYLNNPPLQNEEDEPPIFKNINDEKIARKWIKFGMQGAQGQYGNTSFTWTIDEKKQHKTVQPNKFMYLYLFIIKHNNYLREYRHLFVINGNINITLLKNLLSIINGRYNNVSLKFENMEHNNTEMEIKQYLNILAGENTNKFLEIENFNHIKDILKNLDNLEQEEKLQMLDDSIKKIVDINKMYSITKLYIEGRTILYIDDNIISLLNDIMEKIYDIRNIIIKLLDENNNDNEKLNTLLRNLTRFLELFYI